MKYLYEFHWEHDGDATARAFRLSEFIGISMASLQYPDITVSTEQPFHIFVFHLLLRYLHFFLLFLRLSERNDSIKHTNRRDESIRGISLNGVYFLMITQFFFNCRKLILLLFIFIFFCDNNICFTDWGSKKEKNNKW